MWVSIAIQIESTVVPAEGWVTSDLGGVMSVRSHDQRYVYFFSLRAEGCDQNVPVSVHRQASVCLKRPPEGHKLLLFQPKCPQKEALSAFKRGLMYAQSQQCPCGFVLTGKKLEEDKNNCVKPRLLEACSIRLPHKITGWVRTPTTPDLQGVEMG